MRTTTINSGEVCLSDFDFFPDARSLASYLEIPFTRSPWSKVKFVFLLEGDVPSGSNYRKNLSRAGHPWLALDMPDEPGVFQLMPRSSTVSGDVPKRLKTEKHANRVERASDCKCGINKDAWVALDVRIPISATHLQRIANGKICWNESKDVVDQIHLCINNLGRKIL